MKYGDDTGKVVAVIVVIFATIVSAFVACGNINECMNEGHSYTYCQQLLYGRNR